MENEMNIKIFKCKSHSSEIITCLASLEHVQKRTPHTIHKMKGQMIKTTLPIVNMSLQTNEWGLGPTYNIIIKIKIMKVIF